MQRRLGVDENFEMLIVNKRSLSISTKFLIDLQPQAASSSLHVGWG
jgi:hypothetical protein